MLATDADRQADKQVGGQAGRHGDAAGEPASDAPPRFGAAAERRMPALAYSHWASLLRGRTLPHPDDLDLAAIPDIAPSSLLIEIALGAGAPVLRFVGPRLAAQAAVDAGMPAAAVPPDSLVARLLARLPELLAARAPIGFADELALSAGSELLCRGILLPLSTDGDRIDSVHGVINWKEVVAPAMARALAAEIGAALRVRRAAPAADPFA